MEKINITVIDDYRTTTTREGDPDDRWDRDDTYEEHDIRGFKVDEKYGDVTVGFVPEYDKEYYLLIVNYDTGDSFGRDEGRIDIIDMYQDVEIAQENKKRIMADAESSGYSVKLKHETGKEYDYFTSWKGYFERFNDVDIFPVRRLP